MKTNKKLLLIGAVAFLVIIIGIFFGLANNGELKYSDITENGQWLAEVYTDKAIYQPNEEVTIFADLNNASDKDMEGHIIFRIMHLGKEVGRIESEAFKISKGEKSTINVNWLPPEDDYQGYLVEAWYISGRNTLDKLNTAIDVSSDWSRFPRYGYITNFGQLSEAEIDSTIEELNRYHISGLQFYDWQYKHHQPLAGTVDEPADKWKEIANRDVYFDSVMGYIDSAHSKGIKTMNYNLLFGSYVLSENDGVKPEWGLYKDSRHTRQDGHPLPNTWATGKILLENPANEGWQNYILNEEKEVFEVFPFDGWHIDQLGERGRLYDYDGNIIALDQTYAPFIEKANQELGVSLVMNGVNDYGQIYIANSPVEFLYTEVWSPNNSYGQLKNIIDRNVSLTDGEKNIVLAAYMNYKNADKPGEFNKASILLADSVIFASGGAHFELGDTGMLGKEYFPNENLKMTEDLQKELKDYYHFLVGYQNLLRDNLTYTDKEINITDYPYSDLPEKKSLWYFTKEKNGYEILHIINFLNQDSLEWRDDYGVYQEPDTITDLTIKYYTDEKINEVYMASPDFDRGSSQKLTFKTGNDDDGNYVQFVVPSLKYWDMVYFVKDSSQ